MVLMKSKFCQQICLIVLAIAIGVSAGANTARGDFTIVVNYTTSVTMSQQAAFENAANTWASLISGYQDGFVVNRSGGSSYKIGQTIDTLFISAAIQGIDGAGGILGSAGPNQIIVDSSGFTLASDGAMTFDIADVAALEANGSFGNVILHEMAHVMGFGTLWTNNGVYVNNSGEFTGSSATAAWQADFGQTGTPDVELQGGGGTANGHWNENLGGGGLTGITDAMGRDMRDELMTGWLNANSFISDMTIASFVDIGYSATAIPEPAMTGGFSLIMLGWITLRRREPGRTGIR